MMPDLTNKTDRLAHYLSEVDNESAPIGWERYRFMANILMAKFDLEPLVMNERFLDPAWTVTDERDDRTFQQKTARWMRECFGQNSPALALKERRDRFLEEALELFQAAEGTVEDAHTLVDYVYERPRGVPAQEVGGVMTTLAGLCSALDLSMFAAADQGLKEAKEKTDKIRSKYETKAVDSPLPGTGEE